jgi:predicted nuclease of predicted toxin-antitoxin system
MWLLDHNLPVQLRGTLADLGVESETAVFRGWEKLRNAELLAVAHQHGFRLLLTRDGKFAESAAATLSCLSDFAVVVVRLPQRSWRLYDAAFRSAWSLRTIVPMAGVASEWPTGRI